MMLTFAEVESLPDPNNGRYELRHGELVVVPPPMWGHYLVQHQLRTLIEPAAEETGIVSDCKKISVAIKPFLV